MESAITTKGQATIPKAIRDYLGLKPGDRIKFFHSPQRQRGPLAKAARFGPPRHRQAAAAAGDDRGNGGGRNQRRHRIRAPSKAPMIGLDTNVLVRYLAQDDPAQSARATEIIERRLTDENPGFVSVVAMAEMVWVLQRAYGLSDKEVIAAIERTLQADVLVVDCEQQVFAAMTAVKEGRGSFADALIGALGTAAGCSATLTFDRKALRLPEFELA